MSLICYFISCFINSDQGDGAMLGKTDKLLLKSQAGTVCSPELRGNVSCSKSVEVKALHVTSDTVKDILPQNNLTWKHCVQSSAVEKDTEFSPRSAS